MRRLALALVLALGLVAPALAGPYRIGPGDEVDVQVWRESDLSGHYVIDPAGNLQHVLAGEIPAQGRTLDELAQALRARLERDYLRKARVSVTLVRSERRKAWVLGEVAKPGQYPVDDSSRLLDVVFAAGGVTGGDSGVEATLYRMGEPEPGQPLASPKDREPLERRHIDLAALLGGDLSANGPVQAGDVLVVSRSEDAKAEPVRRVRVVGEVARPGTYELDQAPTALDAVLAAGGFTEYASTNRVRLVREHDGNRRVLRLRLGDVVEGRDGSDNVSLEAGDMIVVPESFF